MDQQFPRPDDTDRAQRVEQIYNEMFAVASATECTGLIPTPPVNKSEADSYTDIYDIPMTKSEPDHGLQSIKKTTENVGNKQKNKQ
ncbi:hypothetical protein [Solibaculum mannosilyticum]|uniref:Uncharacterized protein n=1 Tax=Solibaculum mannosilyticum TaxID=2780922 RepID=A0A7I8D182_9FIRM|nr:hypothetical protein [Solibaculum mannosilyticum]MCO7137580.1 hypothetical protein [[Clostridium] leptum]BCI60561.1 hypothetical protein C12CBH8_12000 [Solibaculum mannosilyticum]CZT56943.1 hypothetical protein BN3661_01684 [Eubacteriaceae bacterium CHKCI005]